MEFKKVTAIISTSSFKRVEEKLVHMGVKGMTVGHVMGFGEFANYFARDWLVSHVRIEIFSEKDRAEGIARAIVETAHTGSPGDGLVAILPVEKILRIRTKEVAMPHDI